MPKRAPDKSRRNSPSDFSIEADAAVLQDIMPRFYHASYGQIIALFGVILMIPDFTYELGESWFTPIGLAVMSFSLIGRYLIRGRVVRTLDLAARRRSERLLKYVRLNFIAFLLSGAIGWFLIAMGLLDTLPSHTLPRQVLLMILASIGILGSTNACYKKRILMAYILLLWAAPVYHFSFREPNHSFTAVILMGVGYFYIFGLGFRRNFNLVVKNLVEERRNRSQFHETLESLPLRICVIEDGKVSFLNRFLASYISANPKKVIGQTCASINTTLCLLDKECTEKSLTELQRPVILESHLGESRWHLVAIRHLHDSKVSIIAALDIHDQRTSEIRDIENRARVEASSRMATIGQVAAGIAHEINNPLAIIIAKAEVLRINSGDLTQDQVREGLGKIEATGQRIAKIVRSLRALSRDGKKDPMTRVVVQEVLAEAIGLFEEKFRASAVAVSTDISPDHSVRCRSVELAQALTNLISNALDAIQNQNVHETDRWIRIESQKSWRPGQDIVEIRVINGGPKISELAMDRIGTPFFTTKPAGQGTGLGLTITQRLIHENGGEFRVLRNESNTTFSIRIPANDDSASQAA